MEGNHKEVRLHLETCKFEAVKVVTVLMFWLTKLKKKVMSCLANLVVIVLYKLALASRWVSKLLRQVPVLQLKTLIKWQVPAIKIKCPCSAVDIWFWELVSLILLFVLLFCWRAVSHSCETFPELLLMWPGCGLTYSTYAWYFCSKLFTKNFDRNSYNTRIRGWRNWKQR